LAAPAAAEDPALVVVADAVSVERGAAVDVDVSANDTGPGGAALVDPVIEILTAPSFGRAEVVDVDGPGGLSPVVRYEPALDAPASDQLVYQLTDAGLSGSAQVTFTVTNAPPVALDDSAQVYSAPGSTILIPVLGNDSDADLGALQIAAVTSPSHGTASIVSGGVLYDPVDDYIGPDSFSYTMQDGQGGQATAAVAVAVLDSTSPMTLNPDVVAATAGVAVSVPVLANDSSGGRDPLTVVGASVPASGGSAVVSADGQTIVFTSPTSFVGTDTFTYTVRDRRGNTATGHVTATVTAPVVARAAAVQILESLDVDTTYRVTVTVTGFDATGAAAALQRQSTDGWVEVGRATLGPSGGEISFTPTTRMAGLRAGRSSTPVTLRVLVISNDGQQLATDLQTTTIRASVRIAVSGPLTRSDVRYSYRPGCPVRPDSLRRMSVNYWDYSGALKRGTLIVRSDAVRDLEYVFSEAFDAGFPIKKMKPSDAYYKKGRRSPTASDRAAMKAGNTSAFNCRSVVGNPTKRSMHSYGVAIDINTFQNPYVTGSTYYPRGARKYLKRTPCRKGMICPGGVIATAMRDRGWPWGARWSRPDYQHFSANGG
jgi:hypothetical protein